ncbi:MAG: hypothetical protein WBM83_15535 [Flavobacteriaceae bacterium]
MQTTFIILSLALVAMVFVPFFLMSSIGKKETKKLKSIGKTSVSSHNLKISQQEIWADHYLGIDTDQKKLLYLQVNESDKKELLIDLKTVKDCNKIEKIQAIKTKDKIENRLERLDLEVIFKNGTKTLLNFYDSEKMYSEDYEVNRLEKWKQLILANIPKTLRLERVA